MIEMLREQGHFGGGVERWFSVLVTQVDRNTYLRKNVIL